MTGRDEGPGRPWDVAGVLTGPLRALAGRSLDNARTAAAALSAAVADRRVLGAALREEDADPGPGELARLSRDTCLELLAAGAVGRLAYIARAGAPDVVPVNYRLFEGEVLLRSGPGPKLQAAERGDLVAFEVDEIDVAAASGWSVVVVGRLRRVPEAERLSLPASALPVPWAAGPRSVLVRLTPVRISGRRLG